MIYVGYVSVTVTRLPRFGVVLRNKYYADMGKGKIVFLEYTKSRTTAQSNRIKQYVTRVEFDQCCLNLDGRELRK